MHVIVFLQLMYFFSRVWVHGLGGCVAGTTTALCHDMEISVDITKIAIFGAIVLLVVIGSAIV